MSNEKQPVALAVIEPQNMDELVQFSADASASNLYGYTQSQALIVAMRGRDLGFSYSQALAAFDVIKGKLSMKADAMVAACLKRRDICEYFRVVEVTATRAVWKTKRADDSQEVVYEFTMDDAIQADLAGPKGQNESGYRKHPKRMLSARAKAFLARDVYPDILLGLGTEEEVMEAHEEPIVKTIVTQIAKSESAPAAQAKPEAPAKDATDTKPSEPTKAAPVAVNGAATPAANGNAAPAATFDAAKFMTSLENAIKGATTAAKLDAIFGTFEKRRAQLSAENDDAAVAMFGNARARVEGASAGAAQ